MLFKWVLFQIWDKFIPWRFPDVQSMSEFTFSSQLPLYLSTNPVINYLKSNQLHNLVLICIYLNQTNQFFPLKKVCYHLIILSSLRFHTLGFPIFKINEIFDETDTWLSVQGFFSKTKKCVSGTWFYLYIWLMFRFLKI